EPVADVVPEPAPETAGGRPRLAAGAHAVQATHPGALPQRRGVWVGHLRRRGGGAPILPPGRRRHWSARGCAARREPPESARVAPGLAEPRLPGACGADPPPD